LEIVPDEPVHKFQPSPLISAPSPDPPTREPVKAEANDQFVDPAILSIGRPPTVKRSGTVASATLTEPFDNLNLEPNRLETSELDTIELDISMTNEPSNAKARKTRVKKAESPVDQAFQELLSRPSIQQKSSTQNTISQNNGSQQKKSSELTRGRKQRQVITEDVDSLGTLENASAARKPKKTQVVRKHKSRVSETQNGWATEEATDIQEMGDFDFQANLSKFDKSEIFKKLKEDDQIAQSARLVGHNRLPRPGTAGGKNLHWTENVLDTPKLPVDHGIWNSEAGDSFDEIDPNLLNSGRLSRRDKSQSRTRLSSSRKGSRILEEPTKPRILSQITSQGSFERSGSPKPKFPKKGSQFVNTVSSAKPSLRIQGTNKLCPCVTPLQMLEFEQFAVAELGLSEDILSENAARGIAELAAMQVSSANGDSTVVVVAVGNHKTGARALAASRHLHNHGHKVLATIMGSNRDEDLLEAIRQQSNAYVKAGGQLIKPDELLEKIKTGFQPTLLIDALLGMHACFEDLRREDQQWCFELILWTNNLDSLILSVDVPSGYDAANGGVTITEDNSILAFAPDIIISLGIPKPYLLEMLGKAGPNDATKIFVADIGIGSMAWKRLGNRRRRGIEFEGKWLVELRFQPGVE
jgi:enhancer of mRNA-decapping protein 3